MSHVTRSSSPAHDRAREFPGMIGCFRAAPNSGPTSKSLPGPQFSFGLDLFSGRSINPPVTRRGVLGRTISEWNRLPANIVEADSPQAFKAGLATLAPVAPEMPWSGTHRSALYTTGWPTDNRPRQDKRHYLRYLTLGSARYFGLFQWMGLQTLAVPAPQDTQHRVAIIRWRPVRYFLDTEFHNCFPDNSNIITSARCLDFSGHVRSPGLLLKLTQSFTSVISVAIQLLACDSK